MSMSIHIHREPRVSATKTTPCWKCWSNLWLCAFGGVLAVLFREQVLWPGLTLLPNYAQSHHSLKTASTGTPWYSHSGISRKTCASAVGTHLLHTLLMRVELIWRTTMQVLLAVMCMYSFLKYIGKTYTITFVSSNRPWCCISSMTSIEILTMCIMYMNMYT